MKKRQIQKKSSESPPAERIQKLMASAGLGSRRAIEKRIANGEVMVNNQQAVLGQSASIGDTITFENHPWGVV